MYRLAVCFALILTPAIASAQTGPYSISEYEVTVRYVGNGTQWDSKRIVHVWAGPILPPFFPTSPPVVGTPAGTMRDIAGNRYDGTVLKVEFRDYKRFN